MCGIVGIFDTRESKAIDRAVLHRMNEIQHHRGPDDGGMFIAPGVGLGHRRLSIIDISTGHQPLKNEDGSVVVVFNGEIYNFQSLIIELQSHGHTFKTQCDTEVIVHAWEEWGEQCVDRFRGMFAFALWDSKKELLFLARDRLGVKPLFYAYLSNGDFIFGSELKALLTHGGLHKKIDPYAVEEYFALGYVPEPRTIFTNAKKLSPASTLIVSKGETRREPKRYWDVRFSLDNPVTLEDALAELLDRLKESIKLRMISDVPLGAFLSGGVDSSSVVAIMAGLSDNPVNTCSISFSDPKFDESSYAQDVAARYKTRHFSEHVESDDFDLLDKLVDLYDEPYADSSALPTYRLCQLARKHVTVALSGDGADESFGGYRRYKMHVGEEQVRSRIPLNLRRPIFSVLGRVYPKADWAPRFLRAKTTFQALAKNSSEAYFQSVSICRDDSRRHLFSRNLLSDLGGYTAAEVFLKHAANAQTDDPLALVQYLDLQTYLIGDINTKVDRASMANSLEVREPLMDHPLVEWLASLPSGLKIKNGESKYLLKKTMEDHLSHDLLYRPKMGFCVPLSGWFQGPLREKVRENLLCDHIKNSGFFNMRQLSSMIVQHEKGIRDYGSVIWALLMFSGFLKKNII